MKWRAVFGMEKLYEVSSTGEVRTKERLSHRVGHTRGEWQIRQPRIIIPGEKGGYLWANLTPEKGKRKFLSIHKLVVEAFIRPLQKSEEVNHINGDKKDNRVENLEIVRDKFEHSKKTWERLRNEWYEAGIEEGRRQVIAEYSITDAAD